MLESKLTEEEIYKSLQNIKTNKSPGHDGLTSEFYKHFWYIIKNPLLNGLNYSLENGNMSEEQKKRYNYSNTKKRQR